MLQYLDRLKSLLPSGTSIERTEVIKRYRSSKQFDKRILHILQMTEFFMLSRNEKGEISLL
jgi:hypothetical protein